MARDVLHGLDLISLIRVSEVTGVKSSNIGVMLPDRTKLLLLGDGKDSLMSESVSRIS